MHKISLRLKIGGLLLARNQPVFSSKVYAQMLLGQWLMQNMFLLNENIKY